MVLRRAEVLDSGLLGPVGTPVPERVAHGFRTCSCSLAVAGASTTSPAAPSTPGRWSASTAR